MRGRKPGVLLRRNNPIAVSAAEVCRKLRALADPAIAEHSQRFFKTGEGEYGEGDRFLGIRVPVLRAQVRKYPDISLGEIQKLLKSPYHEVRLLALLFMVREFAKGGEAEKTTLYQQYLNNTRYINNWDLVDCSAPQVVGAYLEQKNRKRLYQLVNSGSLWERRIAIMATFHFIKKEEFEDTLKISERLLNDREDLIHKATGWMLREVGKRDLRLEEEFLKKHYKNMPRTMLRYAIEKFPQSKRKRYLEGKQ